MRQLGAVASLSLSLSLRLGLSRLRPLAVGPDGPSVVPARGGSARASYLVFAARGGGPGIGLRAGGGVMAAHAGGGRRRRAWRVRGLSARTRSLADIQRSRLLAAAIRAVDELG